MSGVDMSRQLGRADRDGTDTRDSMGRAGEELILDPVAAADAVGKRQGGASMNFSQQYGRRESNDMFYNRPGVDTSALDYAPASPSRYAT